jgi:hypothetical protein
MPSTELSQLGVVERLRPERDAGDPGAAQRGWVAAFVGPGVRLDGDLAAVGDPEPLAHAREDPLDLVGGQQ